MAEASCEDPRIMYGRLLFCSICKGIFSKPKALPCMHTFCENCLREYVCSRSYDTVGRFPCPLCREEISIPPEGVDAFRENIYVTSILGSFDLHQPNGDCVQPSSSSANEISFGKNSLMPKYSFGQYGTGTTNLTSPVGLVVTKSGYIVVSDKRDNRVMTFDMFGLIQVVFACHEKIHSIAISEKDTVFVANSQPSHPLIVEYSLKGTRLREFGMLNRLECIHGVTLLKDPFHVVATAPDTSSLYFLNGHGKLVQKLSSRGTYGQPFYLTTNSRNEIIISDYLNHCVKVFDRYGKCRLHFGGVGVECHLLFQPLGVCTDDYDNIIVADSGNRLVKVFSHSSGKLIKVLVDLNGRKSSTNTIQPVNVAFSHEHRNLIILMIGKELTQIQVFQYSANDFVPASLKQKSSLKGCLS